MDAVDLTVIIINWNSRDYLKKCLDLMLSGKPGINMEIVVLDNASFDGSETLIKESFPYVRYIQSQENLGFARANNEAFRFSHGRNLLFLNPDTEPDISAIEVLYRELNTLPEAGLVGAKLFNSDGTIQTSSIQKFPTIINLMLDTEILRKLFPKSKLWGMKALFENIQFSTEVDVVSGACLMIKREVFEGVRLFTSDYFMYSEDVDLCYKVRELGWKNYYVPTVHVVHHGGGSSARSSQKVLPSIMLTASQFLFFRRTRGYYYSLLFRLAVSGTSIVRIGLILLAWLIPGVGGKDLLIQAKLKKWTARLRWSIGCYNVAI